MGIAACGLLTLLTLRIATTTTTLSALTQEVAGESTSVAAISPGGSCPGHFDLGAKDALDIVEADVFLYQGWEPWLPQARELRGDRDPRMLRVEGPKDLMVPPAHIAAVRSVAALLTEVDPAGADGYLKRAQTYCKLVEEEAASIRELCRQARTDTVRVLCSNWQRPLLDWMGYEIADTFGPPDEATAASIGRLARGGGEIDIVVDNLQSGPPVGGALAGDLGARHVVLTNFVLEDGYLGALRSNAAVLLDFAEP